MPAGSAASYGTGGSAARSLSADPILFCCVRPGKVDRLRQQARIAAILLAWVDEGKVGLLAAMTEALVAKSLEAGKLVGGVGS